MGKLSLYLNTIKYMKHSQLAARVRAKNVMSDAIPPFLHKPVPYPPHLFMEVLDAEPTVTERFLPERIIHDEVSILNRIRKVDFTKMEVVDGDASPLWLFNLHYGEYLIPFICKGREEGSKELILKGRDIFRSLAESFDRPGYGRAPYVISLQIVNLLIAWDALGHLKSHMNGKAEGWFYGDLYRKYKFLQNHMEKHLLANHYFENIKALLILAMTFGEEEKVEEYLKLLNSELKEQILPDGMHYERSFMYHKLILEDLFRIVLASYDTPWKEKVKELIFPVARKMCNFLDKMESDIPRTPLFNDAGDNVAKPAKNLLEAAAMLGIIDRRRDLLKYQNNPATGFAFPHAGYYRQNKGIFSIIVDAGEVGPSYNPGHHQNDCLSFELFTKNRPVFVNSGCESYFGDFRSYSRSTKAHNTFLIDDTEQSQCWSSHRVAKRMKNVSLTMDENGFIGQFTDYAGHIGRRTLVFDGYRLTIKDECLSPGRHTITSYLHLAPQFKVEKISEKEIKIFDTEKDLLPLKLTVEKGKMEVFDETPDFPYSPEFGLKRVVSVLKFTGEGIKVIVEE